MATNGPPVLEHLLTRVRRWLFYFAGGRFWPLNHNHIDAERPADDRVPPDDQEEEEIDVVGLDDVVGLQEVEVEPRGGYREDERVEYARFPSPPLQQLLPLHYGIEWHRQGHAVPFYPVQYPLPYSVPYALPLAVQYPAAYHVPYAVPLAVLHPVHYTYPYFFPYAAPAFPQAFPFAYHYVFPYSAPYAAPHRFAYPYAFPQAAPAFPYVFPFADPYAIPAFAYAFPFGYPYVFLHDAPDFPHAFPFAERYPFLHAAPALPQADPDVALEQLIAIYWRRRPEDGEVYDVFEIEDENGIVIPELDVDGVGSVENIGPLSREDSSEEFSFSSLFNSFPGAPESPSTSGLSSSTRRRRKESNGQEAAAKRPRWSDESDTD